MYPTERCPDVHVLGFMSALTLLHVLFSLSLQRPPLRKSPADQEGLREGSGSPIAFLRLAANRTHLRSSDRKNKNKEEPQRNLIFPEYI